MKLQKSPERLKKRMSNGEKKKFRKLKNIPVRPTYY